MGMGRLWEFSSGCRNTCCNSTGGKERSGSRTCLHTNETTPGVEYGRVNHAGDEAEENQNHIGPVLVDILGHEFLDEREAGPRFESAIGVACGNLSVEHVVIDGF
jgi:hypothetical protein